MPKILVIGESCKDKFIYGEVNRICPEAPVPVFNPIEENENDGMAGNVVKNLNTFGVNEIDLITQDELITKTRVVEKKHNYTLLRIDENDTVTTPLDISKIDFSQYLCVVVSDYCKGFLTESILREISYKHPLTFLDTKKSLSTWALNFTFIKVNDTEWNKSVKDGAKALVWTDKLIVTRGENGADFNGVNYPVEKTAWRDLSGAGDTFLAALVHSYLLYKDIIKAIKYANEMASIVIQKRGVATI